MNKFFLIFCLVFWIYASVFAAWEKVEEVFYDLDASYEFRDELQTLYDRWMIVPDISGTFWADNFLNRDEFVGIALEVVCERCIQPHTEFETIEKYFNEKVYFDLDNRNPYFYCIAEADNQSSIRGYDIGESCQNGKSQFWERPFCPANRINLEEAVAVLLRNSGIYTIEQNRETIRNIDSWITYQKIANDVSPKNSDGSAYTFYGYLEKALSYEIVEYDSQWNEKIRKLLEPDEEGNIFPKKQITKEEFLRMSYIVLKSNSCVALQDHDIAGTIDILEASCWPDEVSCAVSALDDTQSTYDFRAQADGFCADWVDTVTGYSWRFHNLTTWEEFFHYWEYIDNIQLPSAWEWRVSLNTKDRCGSTGQVFSTIVVEGSVNTNGTWDIQIFPGICSGDCLEIDSRDLEQGTLYDLKWNITDVSSENISDTDYLWTITHRDSGQKQSYTWEILDDFSFWKPGNWQIDMQITASNNTQYTDSMRVNISNDNSLWDASLNQNATQNFVSDSTPKITGNSGISTTILTDTIFGYTNLVGSFWVLTNGGAWPYTYSWTFWDGNSGNGKNIEYVYTQPWIFQTKVNVVDGAWNSASATVLIKVLDGDTCEQDADEDGIQDCEDLCPIVSGDPQNAGCPIFEEKCDQSCGCSNWYTCDDSDTLSCGISGVCKKDTSKIQESCLYDSKQGWIFGNTLCTTCPCNSSLDFLADIRRCDILFPAITSSDGAQIYSQGNLWEVQ